MKIVINVNIVGDDNCYFCLPKEVAMQFGREQDSGSYDIRDHPILVKWVEEHIGEDGYVIVTDEQDSEHVGRLKIVEVPDDIDWIIEEDDNCSECVCDCRAWF